MSGPGVAAMAKLTCVAAALCVPLALAGCAHYPPNAKLERPASAAGYRLENLPAGGNSDSLLLVLTFSGGGTRAAALAYGVLERLAATPIVWEGKRKRLLDEVDVISSVSGGSYTAAYYALYRERIFTDFEHDFLKRNVQGEIVRRMLAPANLVRTWSPKFGRVDLLSKYLDAHLFHRATFGALLRQGRPLLLINASDMSLGTRFEFTQDQFDLLCSDLNTYPIARAVAASSAVPIVFSPLTLRNYAGECAYREPDWVREALADRPASARRYYKAAELHSYLDRARRPYIHLLDGGLSDNTGLRGLLDRAVAGRAGGLTVESAGGPSPRKVVLIMVSAETHPSLALDRVEAVPSLLQVIRTVKDIPINRYSFETTELFRARFDERAGSAYDDAATFHLVEVTFGAIVGAHERERFMNIPTSFALPAADVDALRQLAGRLLDASPDFQRLLRDIGAPAGSATEPQPGTTDR